MAVEIQNTNALLSVWSKLICVNNFRSWSKTVIKYHSVVILAFSWIGKAQCHIHIHRVEDKSLPRAKTSWKKESYSAVVMNWQDLLCNCTSINPRWQFTRSEWPEHLTRTQRTTTAFQITVVVSANMRRHGLLKSCVTARSALVCRLNAVNIWPS